MRKGMFLRLALTNIKKTGDPGFLYMLSCMGCIAVLYIMMFIVTSPDTVNMRGGRDVAAIVSMGSLYSRRFFSDLSSVLQQLSDEKKTEGAGTLQCAWYGKKAHQSSDACGNSAHRYCESGRRTGGRNPWK